MLYKSNKQWFDDILINRVNPKNLKPLISDKFNMKKPANIKSKFGKRLKNNTVIRKTKNQKLKIKNQSYKNPLVRELLKYQR